MPRLWAFDDRRGWGREVARAGADIGLDVVLFTDPEQPDGPCFVRLDQQGERREQTKSVALALAARGLPVTPSPIETGWYDDKIAQIAPLRPWLPETDVITSLDEALAFAGRSNYPIISKAAEGASAANVRLLESMEDAVAEAIQAFRGGIPLYPVRHGRRQHGYVYWQRFVPGNDHDYRVVICGDHFYGAVQKNRPGTVFASGSGLGYPLTLATEREVLAVNLAEVIAETLCIDWVAFDIVFDGPRPFVTEMSCSWGINLTATSPVFIRSSRIRTGQTAGDSVHRIAAERLAAL